MKKIDLMLYGIWNLLLGIYTVLNFVGFVIETKNYIEKRKEND